MSFRGWFLAAGCLAIGALSGCAPDAGSAGVPAPAPSQAGAKPASKRLKLGMIPKLIGIPYFNACRRGAEEAARELNVDLDYNGPDTADAVRQSEIVNSWILLGYDAIAAAPNNPEAIAPVLKKARERGIRVLTWDTDSAPEAREVFCNQAESAAIARTLVDLMAAELGGAGRVALVSGTETASNQNTWMRLMREYTAEKYPKLVYVDPVEYPGEDDARAYQSAQGLLRQPEPPAGIFGMTSVAAPAVAKAVFDARMAGKVAVTGLAAPSGMRTQVKNGAVKKFALWDPSALGYLTVYTAVRLVEGKLTGEVDAGKLGKLKVKDGQIVLGPPLVFDAANIDTYDF